MRWYNNVLYVRAGYVGVRDIKSIVSIFFAFHWYSRHTSMNVFLLSPLTDKCRSTYVSRNNSPTYWLVRSNVGYPRNHRKRTVEVRVATLSQYWNPRWSWTVSHWLRVIRTCVDASMFWTVKLLLVRILGHYDHAEFKWLQLWLQTPPDWGLTSQKFFDYSNMQLRMRGL